MEPTQGPFAILVDYCLSFSCKAVTIHMSILSDGHLHTAGSRYWSGIRLSRKSRVVVVLAGSGLLLPHPARPGGGSSGPSAAPHDVARSMARRGAGVKAPWTMSVGPSRFLRIVFDAAGWHATCAIVSLS